MSFLSRINVSQMLIRIGSGIKPLAAYQLQEIINYQTGKSYNKDWLIVNETNPYFKMSNGYKQEIVYWIISEKKK